MTQQRKSDAIHSFYCSKSWQKLAHACKIASGGKCHACNQIFPLEKLRAHHITHLTLDNLHNPHVALNIDNIEVLCHDCHNREHRRFGQHGKRQIYLVHGAPCSGKTTYVLANATRRDLIIDLDRLLAAITNMPAYDKTGVATKQVAFFLRDKLLEEVEFATAMTQWENAYIVGCYPKRYDRERIVEKFAAKEIHMQADREECLRRAAADKDRPPYTVDFIESYFANFT